MAQQVQSEIRYLTPPSVDVKKKKYCRFKKSGIRYIDYKDPEFLKKYPAPAPRPECSGRSGPPPARLAACFSDVKIHSWKLSSSIEYLHFPTNNSFLTLLHQL